MKLIDSIFKVIMYYYFCTFICFISTSICNGLPPGPPSGGGASTTLTPSTISSASINAFYLQLHNNSWLVNANDQSSIFSSKTEITSSALSGYSWKVQTYDIPKYNYNFSSNVINNLNSRAKVFATTKIKYVLLSGIEGFYNWEDHS